MRTCGLRQFLAAARAVFEQVCDAELGGDIDALGHLKALDQLLLHELRQVIVCGHVVPLLYHWHRLVWTTKTA
jgi:hypothetical protein